MGDHLIQIVLDGHIKWFAEKRESKISRFMISVTRVSTTGEKKAMTTSK
jgi:hypothetical protein